MCFNDHFLSPIFSHGSVEKVPNKECYPFSWQFFVVFIRMLNNQTQTLVIKNCQWNCMIILRDKEGLLLKLQKQSPEVFCKTGVLTNFTKFTGKNLCQSLFFNKDAGNFIKKRDSGIVSKTWWILEGDLLVMLIDCMIFLFLPPFLNVTRISMSTVSFLAQLDPGIICL